MGGMGKGNYERHQAAAVCWFLPTKPDHMSSQCACAYQLTLLNVRMCKLSCLPALAAGLEY